MLGITSEKAARNLFNDIGIKIQFPSKAELDIIPFEFLGIVKDYNSVDIIQTPDYIEMSSKSYIECLLKLHGWETMSTKSLPDENFPLPKNPIPLYLIPKHAPAASLNKLQVNREDGFSV